MFPNEFSIVFIRGLDDALVGDAPGAEGCHEGVVLAAQDHHVRVRPVYVVVERGQWGLLPSAFQVLLFP
jgi:hypothetical protein